MQDLPPDRPLAGAGIYETTFRMPLDITKSTFNVSMSQILRQNCNFSLNVYKVQHSRPGSKYLLFTLYLSPFPTLSTRYFRILPAVGKEDAV